MTNFQNINDRLERLERVSENYSEAIQGLINLAREQREINNGLIQQQQNTEREIRELRAGIEQLYQIVTRRERNNE